MSQLISEIWSNLRNAGLPEVMLYLPDHSASRCHWDDTTVIGGIRVALLADQERKIVRLLPVDSCTGIGIASPKGVDPSGYKATVQSRLNGTGNVPELTEGPAEPIPPAPVVASAPAPVAPMPIPPPPEPVFVPAPTPALRTPGIRPENPANHWGGLPPRSGGGSRFGTSL